MAFKEKLEIFTFCTYIATNSQRLDILKKCLYAFGGKSDRRQVVVRAKKINIRTLSMAYSLIGEVSVLINKVFTTTILFSVTSAFTYILLTIFGYFYLFYRKGITSNYIMVVVIMWCGMEFFFVSVIAFICENVLTSREELKIISNDIIMNYALPKEVRNEAKILSNAVEAWPLRFSGYEMFFVDKRLLLAIISSTTTYLIFMIQICHF
ncbi:uncharacterized protein LOC123704277 [Colias croceus]|uniref:uncharacterized protein LOC123704277 n=1 Tax=Colias crocea TaxID=72248 RepID=UPI001E280970|nr:uncharacterized protein LOC123704277 [Colias croceus]